MAAVVWGGGGWGICGVWLGRGGVAVVGVVVGDEAVGQVGGVGFGGDAGVEGDDVGGLGVTGVGAVGLDVLLAVGFGDVVVEGLVLFGVVFAAEGERHFAHIAG